MKLGCRNQLCEEDACVALVTCVAPSILHDLDYVQVLDLYAVIQFMCNFVIYILVVFVIWFEWCEVSSHSISFGRKEGTSPLSKREQFVLDEHHPHTLQQFAFVSIDVLELFWFGYAFCVGPVSKLFYSLVLLIKFSLEPISVWGDFWA